MVVDQWSKVVAASVTPVVIISASSLLCLAFYNRLAAIVARLRAVHRERLIAQQTIESLRSSVPHVSQDSDTPAPEEIALLRHRRIIKQLDEQTIYIMRRAKLIRFTLLSLLTTIAFLVLSSLANGVTIIFPPAVFAAGSFFVLGMLVLLLAVGCAMREMTIALNPVEMESDFVLQIELEGEFAAGLNFGQPQHPRLHVGA